eukprot:scaffold21828_cov218-Skeletonema_marinoi.AAC.4
MLLGIGSRLLRNHPILSKGPVEKGRRGDLPTKYSTVIYTDRVNNDTIGSSGSVGETSELRKVASKK